MTKQSVGLAALDPLPRQPFALMHILTLMLLLYCVLFLKSSVDLEELSFGVYESSNQTLLNSHC